MHKFVHVFALMFVCVCGSDSEDNVPIVHAKCGEIRGISRVLNVFGKEMQVDKYLGIPYAEPPIGDLRFRKPVAKQPFEEPYYATKLGNICYQVPLIPTGGSTLSEDCLFLNIFAPAQKKGEGLPVLMFMHGGGFITGSSDPLIADTLAVHGDIIVITINYRLSLFGFLSTEDEHASGNYGFFDQSLAIKWINENIRAFGGDPSRVTVAGESAGSVSAVYQALYDGNAGLFQRLIALSGSITPPLFVTPEHKKDAIKLGKLVGCEQEESETLIDCLRNVPGDQLNQLINDFSNGFMAHPYAFSPNIDGEFIKEDPRAVLNGHSENTSKCREFFSTVDFLSGIDAEEGIQMLPMVLGGANPETFKPSREAFENELIPAVVSFALGSDAPEVIKDLLVHEYTDWRDPENDENRRHKFVNIYSDLFFTVTLVDTIARHESLARRKKGTYMFMLDVAPSVHLLSSTSWSVRANHADELQYLFYGEDQEVWKFTGRENYRPEPWEREFAKEFMNMLSNFVKTGNPNRPRPISMFWPAYTSEQQQYLQITENMTSDSVKSHLLADKFNFWTRVIPSVRRAFGHGKKIEKQEYCDKNGGCPP